MLTCSDDYALGFKLRADMLFYALEKLQFSFLTIAM